MTKDLMPPTWDAVDLEDELTSHLDYLQGASIQLEAAILNLNKAKHKQMTDNINMAVNLAEKAVDGLDAILNKLPGKE